MGHATRYIPIINALLENGHTPIIASDGLALSLLQKEFTLKDLEKVKEYKGLKSFDHTLDYTSLFSSAFSKVNENSEPTSITLST